MSELIPFPEKFAEAALAYLRACPWSMLSEAVPLDLWLPRERRRYLAVVLGHSGPPAGLALYDPDPRIKDWYAEPHRASVPPDPFATLKFGNLDDPPVVIEGEEYALVTPTVTMRDGSCAATNEELELISNALDAVAAFSYARGHEIPQAGIIREALYLPHASVEDKYAGLGYPALWEDDLQNFRATPLGSTRRTPELCELRDRIWYELPETAATLRRWRWTFFKQPEPLYIQDEFRRLLAMSRFLDWSMFMVSAPGEATLAKKAGIAQVPRYTAGMVTALEPGWGYVVRSQKTGDLLRVRDEVYSYRARTGNYLLGAFFPLDNGAYINEVAMPFDGPFEAALLAANDATLAAHIEQEAFGATFYWLSNITALEQCREIYEEFRDCIGGDPVTSWEFTLKMLDEGITPGAFGLSAASRGGWWSDNELFCYQGLVVTISQLRAQ